MSTPFNQHGGLTLVPLPGFESLTQMVKSRIEETGNRENRDTPVDIALPNFGERDSGEPYLQLGKEHIGGHDVVALGSGPGTWQVLGQINLLLSYLVGRRASRIAIVLGYLPLGRSDKDEGANEFAMPNFIMGQMIAATGGRLDRIISVDLHAPQAVMSAPQGKITEISLTRRVVTEAIKWALNTYGQIPICLAFTDDGSAKRAGPSLARVEKDMFDGRALPIVKGAKRRASSRESRLDSLTGDLTAVKDAVVIMIDDEVATGGTANDTAEALKQEYGARAVLAAVTHGIFCGRAVELLTGNRCFIEHLFATDTIPFHNRPALQPLFGCGALTVVPWTDDLGRIIYHHHWNENIREVR